MKPCGYCLIKVVSQRAIKEGKAYSILKDKDGKGYRIFIHHQSVDIQAHRCNEAVLEEHVVLHLDGGIIPSACSCS